MKIRVFLKVFGTLLKLLGALMLIPAVVSLIYGEQEGVVAFVVPALFAMVTGLVMELVGVNETLGNKEGFALVAFGWMGAAMIGAVPYMLLGLGPIDALFESMSGFTTTGATILSESSSVSAGGYWLINATAANHSMGATLAQTILDSLFHNQAASVPQIGNATLNASLNNTFLNGSISNGMHLNGSISNATGNTTTLFNAAENITENATLSGALDSGKTYYGLLFWRSFTQWLGGMGIILLFIAILPNLGVAGRQLFRAEVPGPTEDMIRPRIRGTAKILWGVYLVLTAAEFLLLMLAKMPAYDAICNTFSTMACGGFSPKALSIEAYESPLIELVIIVFMFLAGANFALHYKTMYTDRKSPLKDPEFKFYILLVLASIAIIALFGGISNNGPFETLRFAAFQVVSIVTTTGFTTNNYDLWSGTAKMILFVLMFTGACAGSTAGGIKLVRILLIIRYGRRELIQALHPKAVVPVKLKGHLVREEILHSILSFFALYILIFVVASVLFASICAIPGELGERSDITCFISENGENVVCFGSDRWEGTDEIAAFTSKDPKKGEKSIYFVPNDSVKKKWVEIDHLIYNTSGNNYKRSDNVIGTWSYSRGSMDMVSAASAVAVNLGNVGPGFNLFGPTENYSQIPGLGKIILILCMWIGRLEILTVLILLMPDFWKN